MYDITGLLNKNNILKNNEVPRLVSYPRTGSHWLRIMLEATLGMPSYVQSFFDPNPTSCWGFHIHNRVVANPHRTEGLTANLKNVIYLYRDPVDTIYSMLKYEKKIPGNWDGSKTSEISTSVDKISIEYKNHLKRWMLDNEDIENFMSLTYEDLKYDTSGCLLTICEFLGVERSLQVISEAVERCDKKLTKELTPHDPQALSSEYSSVTSNYTNNRSKFREAYQDRIRDQFSQIIAEINRSE